MGGITRTAVWLLLSSFWFTPSVMQACPNSASTSWFPTRWSRTSLKKRLPHQENASLISADNGNACSPVDPNDCHRAAAHADVNLVIPHKKLSAVQCRKQTRNCTRVAAAPSNDGNKIEATFISETARWHMALLCMRTHI